MNSLIKTLQKSYYLDLSTAQRLKMATLYALFVFGFLYFFKPFGLHQLGSRLLPVALGFGAITFSCMLVLNLVVPQLLPGMFVEQSWTVAKELQLNLLNIIVITVCNALFNFWLQLDPPSIMMLWMYLVYTISIAIFPITATVLIKEARARSFFERSGEALSSGLPTGEQQHKEKLVLKGNSSAEVVQLLAFELAYMVSADNYVELYILQNNTISKRLLRSTLKEQEEQLAPFAQFWRCHKSYLVNMDLIERVSGNAQGFKLHLRNCSVALPVSRANNQLLKEKLARQQK